jgi:hypothetical protein
MDYYYTNKIKILEQQKIYREANKLTILENQRIYYKINKKIKLTKTPCEECDCYITDCNKIRHDRTKKHIENMRYIKKFETRIICFD